MQSRTCTFALSVLVLSTFNFYAAAIETISFQDVTDEAGLRRPLAGLMGHGAAVGDFNGDGLTDIYVGGFSDRLNDEYAPATGPVRNRLFKNLGERRFQVARQPAVETFARTSGAVFVDLDNDGSLELFVANNTRVNSKRNMQPQRAAQLQYSQLFRHRKDTFIDITRASQAVPARLQSVRNIGVLDYDRDGLLDLFIVEDKFRRGSSSRLLRNLGDLEFADRTVQAGLPEDAFGLGLAIADVNQDGWPDIFLPHSNRMFVAVGDGRYAEPASLQRTFAWEPLDNEDWPCGAAFADLNADGKLDLVLSIHSVVARNRVFINESTKDAVRFRDVTNDVGLATPVPVRCPHCEVQDFNNDGLPDIYMSAAWKDASGKITPLIYVNQGIRDGLPHFQAPRAFDKKMVYFPAGPTADFDNDGRVDLLLVNWFADNHTRLLMNETGGGHWLNVRVQGKSINRMGIGSRIEVYAAGKLAESSGLLGTQELATGYGYASGQVAACHFGLAKQTTVDIRVILPSGKQLERLSVKANQRLVIQE